MTCDPKPPLEALARRLAHVGAIAELIARTDDGDVSLALRGIADMVSAVGDQLDEILAPMRLAAGEVA